MAHSDQPISLAVTIIVNENGELLLDYNTAWGAFTFPITKIGLQAGPTPDSAPVLESAESAALRAAVEVLGRPLKKGHHPHRVSVQIPPFQQSARDGEWKHYQVEVFVLRAPLGTPHPLAGHSAVWIDKERIGELSPISPTVGPILDALTTAIWANLMHG